MQNINRILGAALINLVILSILLASCQSTPANTITATVTLTTTPTPIVPQTVNGIPRFTPQSLLAQWQTNIIAADYNYKGKTIQVVGTITSFYRAGALGFDMTGGNVFDGGNVTVNCLSFTGVNQLLNLAVGQTVVVQGTCLGIQGNSPQLTSCSIVS